jgi:hypothetical protein
VVRMIKSVLQVSFDENKQPILPKFIDTGKSAEKLKNLKDYLKSNFTVSYFTNTEDLAKKVSQDLPRLLLNSNIEIEDKEILNEVEPFESKTDFTISTFENKKPNKGLKLIITDRNSWILDEIIDTLDNKDYGILVPSMNNDHFDTLHKSRNSNYSTHYTIYTDPEIIEKCQCVIYIDGLAFERGERDNSNFYKYIFGAYTPLLAYLIKAESLGKRIIFISEHNSMTQNDLVNFIYHNIGSRKENKHEQISHPSIWLPLRHFNELEKKLYDQTGPRDEKKEEQRKDMNERSLRFRNSLGKIIDNLENEIIPISISTFARKNKLKNIAVIYNPNDNFSNIEIANAINSLYSLINQEPLHFDEHQNSSLIDYLKGSEQGITKLIESIIFCIPKLKEMKLQRLKTEKEIEKLIEETRTNKIANDFSEQENVVKLVKEIFDCMDKADNGTKLLLANKLIIEKKLGNNVISEAMIEPINEHIDI